MVFLLPLALLAGQGPRGSRKAADAAAGLELRAWLVGETVRVSVRFDSPHAREVLPSLREGLKSQISFQLRVYRRGKGPLAFLGDRLLLERRVTRTASLDLFENRYSLADEAGRRRFVGQETFLDEFFGLRDFPLGSLSPEQRGECYVLARGRLDPVRVAAPLDIVRLVTSLTSFSSSWIRAAIEARPLSSAP